VALSQISTAGITFSPVIAGLGVGVALSSAPGPVQAVLLAESVQGGLPRGFRALAGANLTFGALLAGLALGLSLGAPRGAALGALQVVGGAFLLWLSTDAFRPPKVTAASVKDGRFALPPWVRGALAVLLNPGAWLFLAAVASPLFASAEQRGGAGGALAVAAAMIAAIAAGDAGVVLLGGVGLRRAGDRVGRWVRRALGALLAGFGGWLLVTGVISLATG
jgi:threonine/homoserine/homoserine lactone efflux protein